MPEREQTPEPSASTSRPTLAVMTINGATTIYGTLSARGRYRWRAMDTRASVRATMGQALA